MIFGEAPANRTASWHPEPNTRGSFTILSTCLLTLGLSIWTAVHLNIPEQNRSPKRRKWDPRGWTTKQQWRKVGWLILGMLAPEMIAFTAWVQRREARRFTKDIRNILSKENHPKCNGPESSDPDLELGTTETDQQNSATRYEWTNVHSFYAVMGGFVFDTSDLPVNEKFLPGSRDRVTLKPEGILYLAEHEPSLLPDLSEAAIKDKSKANALAKAIVCLQATWFIIQCISRISQSLSISLLELNTFAHAICALLIYFLWWDKPLDIEEPTPIRGRRSHGLCAMMCFYDFSFCSSESRHLEFIVGSGKSPVQCLPDSFIPQDYQTVFFRGNASLDLQSQHLKGELRKLYMGQTIAGFRYNRSNNTWLGPASGIEGKRGILSQHRPYRYYGPEDERRLVLVAGALGKYRLGPNNFLSNRVENWPADFNFVDILDDIAGGWFTFNNDFIAFCSAFTLAGFSYGALHLLGWEAPFTSHTQSILWRMSGITVAASGVALTTFVITGYALRLLRFHDRNLIGSFDGSDFIDLLLFGLGLFYLFARTYLVVECFISFPYLPDDVFKQPSWTYYFPHIT